MDKDNIFNTIVAGICTLLTYLLGAWDKALIILVLFMALDYATGFISGIINKELNSHKGFNGILRKCTIILVLIVGVLLDRLLNDGTWVFRTLVCYFYIANEGLSILENVGKCGVPLPQKLKEQLEQLKNKEE